MESLADQTVELEAFQAMASHDVRTPMSVIAMAVHLIEQAAEGTASAAEIDGHLRRIERAISNMTALMDDVLAFARTGHGPLAREAIDVSAMAEQIIATLREGAPDREVVTVVAPGIAANADPVLFRVLLGALLASAWRYTARRAGARIEVGARDATTWFVRDNGNGFDPAEQSRMFAPLEHAPGARDFGGTGVGLATAQRIVARHGGTITADSKLGDGTTFYVTM